MNIDLVIVWVFRVRRDVNTGTISKCFTRCVFQFKGNVYTDDENTPLVKLMMIPY